LASEIKIKSIDDSKEEKQINIFHYPEGLGEIIDYELEKRFMHTSPCFKLNFKKDTTFSYSLAVAFIDSWHFKPKTKVYANYEETILGGSLLDGIVQGLKKFFREEALKRQMKVNLTSSRLKKHFLIYASVTGKLSYLGSTRSKLGTPKVQTETKKFLYEELKLYFANKSDKIEEILEAFQDE
jgi:DNA gyrase/topoisomerase IV subunit B